MTLRFVGTKEKAQLAAVLDRWVTLVAACCSVLQRVALQCITVCCSVLQGD